MNQVKRIILLGATGMLGNAVLRLLVENEQTVVLGSIRSIGGARLFPANLREHLLVGVNVENTDSLIRLFEQTRPDVVINCVGLVKQRAEADDPLQAIPINALLPHRLARLCQIAGARLVHISTDCVFSGLKGMYSESDLCDAQDLYGQSKHLGEVDYPNAITLRTSIIGHELGGAHGLIGWFLAQQGPVRGFTRAVFSGLPTVELARLIRDQILPRPELHGVYHVSVDPINKFDLLQLVAAAYERDNEITPDDKLVIDRSLDSSRFRHITGYIPPAWTELVRRMREFG